jgi:ankyrin repeat protein
LIAAAKDAGYEDVIVSLLNTNSDVIINVNCLDKTEFLWENEDKSKLKHIDFFKEKNAFKNWRALHWAALNNHLNATKILLNNSNILPNPNLWVGYYKPIHLATLMDHKNIVEYFVQNKIIGINIKTKYDGSSLNLASKYNKIKVVDYLINNIKTDINSVTADSKFYFVNYNVRRKTVLLLRIQGAISSRDHI